MSGETFYGLREMVLPGPAQTTGYRSVLVIGTTGAGKSTLIRQLMGTGGADAFPATSASKTTVAETELLLAPGDYYAVATFMPLVEVRAYVEENVVAAGLSVFDDRPQTEIRARLLDHVDQRFRLRYLLGDPHEAVPSLDEPGEGEPADAGSAAVDESRLSGDTAGIVTEIHRLLDEAIAAEIEAMVSGGVATAETAEEELHVLLKDRLPDNSTVVEIVEFLISEIKARIDILAPADVVSSNDGWPLYWRSHETDRSEFLRKLRTFGGNDHADFGTLLTPLINGIRVRGPFHPTWARDPLCDVDRP